MSGDFRDNFSSCSSLFAHKEKQFRLFVSFHSFTVLLVLAH